MRLLIVGTLDGHISAAAKVVRERGIHVSHVHTQEEALAFLRQGGADAVFIDVKLSVSAFVQQLECERIHTPLIACGIGNETQLAIQAIKAGAQEYLPLPPDGDLIVAVLESICKVEECFIYRDPAMERVVKLAEQISVSEASVLITGESGTGKEVIARFIHEKSRRKSAPFISINCAAIPDNLLESELFGHEKGAFTGAIARRIGKFEEANGGTLLLDEITEMHPQLQAKLLRAIQEREIDRVGGAKPVKINIRLLATSNRDLESAVKSGVFREDLYFRLNVVSIHLPALRERPSDIAILAEAFVHKYCKINGVPQKTLSSQVIHSLTGHPWRGNVRELENIIHRAVLMSAESEITDVDIHLEPTVTSMESKEKGFVGRKMADVERDLILGTLSHCSGNRTHAAIILGISIRTLRNRLKQYRDEGAFLGDDQFEKAC